MLFLEMMQWKNFMSRSTSFRFQKMLFCCFFFCFFSFMCHVCVLSLTCLFIILGKFDALHQLSVKRILWKYSIQSLKTADAIHSCEIMADATFFMPPCPSWALLCFQISVEPHIPKGPANVKTTLYQCTMRLFRAATRAQQQLFLVLFLLCFLVWQVRTCTFYMCPVTQKSFSGMVDLVCFKPAWSATKASYNLLKLWI